MGINQRQRSGTNKKEDIVMLSDFPITEIDADEMEQSIA